MWGRSASARLACLRTVQRTAEGGGTVRINTEDMELAGEVLQDLCAALGLTEVESTADFPQVLAVCSRSLART